MMEISSSYILCRSALDKEPQETTQDLTVKKELLETSVQAVEMHTKYKENEIKDLKSR